MAETVILLGAGASVADVATRPLKSRPPLDKRFFQIAASATKNDARVGTVATYLHETYDIDILTPAEDSLEGVMARLYPDLFNPLLKQRALVAFQALLRLFTDRLARTTNNLRATQKRLLYRIISRYLAEGTDPGELTIITFNQDLQVEKTLELLSNTARWEGIAARLFSFPGMYSVESGTWENVTGPTRGNSDDLFARTDPKGDFLRVLKLHGSLNWYSTHNSTAPPRSAMFNSKRRLSVTRRRTISPDMALSRQARKVYTLPVVVPPVTHKSSVLHESLNGVWTLAEKRLVSANRIVIFGYSCPALDFESSNLLRRAQLKRTSDATVSVVDPDGAVATRYIKLLEPAHLSYYATAHDFLK
jgi:hypothetical protein